MKEIIISTHIPKCGGTTLKNILSKVYGDGFKWVLQSKSPEEASKEINFDTVKCIHGHISYGLHEFFPKGVGYKYITFLRNPYDRILSFYNFLLQNQNTYVVYDWKNSYGWEKDTPFEDWLLDCRLAGQDNDIVRFFAGKSNLNTHEIIERVRIDDMFLARGNLSRYDFIGCTHSFDNDIRVLSEVLKWKILPKYDRDNYFPNRKTTDSLTESEILTIRNTQRFDSFLWEKGH